MSSIAQTSNTWKDILAKEAYDVIEARYASILACTDVPAVFTAVANLLRVEGLPQYVKDDYCLENIVKASSDALAELWRRGVIKQFIVVAPFPPNAEVEAEIDLLLSGVSPTEQRIAVLEAAAKKEEGQIAEVVADWATLNTRAFKQKWCTNPEKAAIYQRAIAAGRI